MNLKKILYSAMTIGAVGAIAFAASNAFFSDEETSTGNTFVAGAIDLKVDSTAHYAGMVCSLEGQWVDEDQELANNPWPDMVGEACTGTWELTDLDESHVFFDYADIKPGDEGENTISLHVESNDSWACATIVPTMNDDNGTNEPELEAGDEPDGDSIFDGELAQNMVFDVWADTCDGGDNYPDAFVGDNKYQEGCDGGILTGSSGPMTPVSFAIADSNGGLFGEGPLTTGEPYYIGVKWSLPTTVGNEVQTDKYMADVSFYVEQHRNNPDFVCSAPVTNGTNVLRLENEEFVAEGPWNVIVDNKYVDMTYNTSGETFDYSLEGQGMAASTQYALIYYADGWPGNNPGKLIGLHTTEADGTLSVPTQNKELDMDLPMPTDGNAAVGAKIWMIPSNAYNSGTSSVTVWPPDYDTWFFEGNVYIHYDDTSVNP